MDEKQFEIAEEIAAALVSNGVDRITRQVKKRDPLFCGLCTECTEPIPEDRLATGAQTCLYCQQVLEFNQTRYAR